MSFNPAHSEYAATVSRGNLPDTHANLSGRIDEGLVRGTQRVRDVGVEPPLPGGRNHGPVRRMADQGAGLGVVPLGRRAIQAPMSIDMAFFGDRVELGDGVSTGPGLSRPVLAAISCDSRGDDRDDRGHHTADDDRRASARLRLRRGPDRREVERGLLQAGRCAPEGPETTALLQASISTSPPIGLSPAGTIVSISVSVPICLSVSVWVSVERSRAIAADAADLTVPGRDAECLRNVGLRHTFAHSAARSPRAAAAAACRTAVHTSSRSTTPFSWDARLGSTTRTDVIAQDFRRRQLISGSTTILPQVGLRALDIPHPRPGPVRRDPDRTAQHPPPTGDPRRPHRPCEEVGARQRIGHAKKSVRDSRGELRELGFLLSPHKVPPRTITDRPLTIRRGDPPQRFIGRREQSPTLRARGEVLRMSGRHQCANPGTEGARPMPMHIHRLDPRTQRGMSG